VNVNDFWFRKISGQGREVGVGDVVRRTRQFVDVVEGCPLFLRVARIASRLERGPIFWGETDSPRRGEMVLSSIVAPVDQRNANIDQFVELTFEGAAHAGVEA